MSRHGQRYNNKGSNTILHYLKIQNRTKSDLKRELGIGRTKLDKKIKNPSYFELHELFTLAGYFRADVMEFVFSVYLNKAKLDNKDRGTLADLVSKSKGVQKAVENA